MEVKNDDYYKMKYEKYKLKYEKLRQIFNFKSMGNDLNDTISLKKGTLLYRTAPNISNYKTQELLFENSLRCDETSKVGIYLASDPLISISMMIEYNKFLEFGIFRLKEDIELQNGKYSFRKFNPERFYEPNGLPIKYVEVQPEENVSHYMAPTQLMKLPSDQWEGKTPDEIFLLPREIQQYYDKQFFGEVFISKYEIDKIELVEEFVINSEKIKSPEDLLNYMKSNDYSNDFNLFLRDGIFILKSSIVVPVYSAFSS
jgi:hypothetical protein